MPIVKRARGSGPVTAGTGFRRTQIAVLAVAGAALLAAPLTAQLTKATPEDLGLAPDGKPRPRAVVPPPPLNPDPRDFGGAWKAVVPRDATGKFNGPAFLATDQEARRACVPDFPPYTSVEGAPIFVQTPALLMIIFEEGHRIRRIRINGTHPANLTPSYWGDSIGHWEGDTLVVETTGIKGRIEIGGPLVSPQVKAIERFTKIEGGAALEDKLSYVDPAGGKVPPPEDIRLNWTKPQKILEWICEDGGELYWGKNRSF